jgi:hypothetical protein
MGRDWEAHDPDAVCDVCGKRGWCWDFYGDLVCPACAAKSADESEPEGDVT